MRKLTAIVTCLVCLLLPLGLFSITPEEIIDAMEANQVHQSARTEGTMTTTDRFGTISRTFISYSRGEDESLIEFTSREEAGQKILRTADEIYLYFPDAEELIRLQGAALRDSVMDSDFSYEDMTGEGGILDDYNVTLVGEEAIDGHDCYVLRLEAKRRSIPYQIEKLWVDKELLVYRQVHRFSKTERLLKEMKVLEIRSMAGKNIPFEFVMSDKMKKNSQTIFRIDKLELGLNLDPALFSIDELTW